MARTTIKQEVLRYNLGGKIKSITGAKMPKEAEQKTSQLIADARRFAKMVNQQMKRLQAAGVPKKIFGNIKLPTAGQIKTQAQAVRAINKFKSVAQNPLYSLRTWNKLKREAEEIYGKGRRFKVIRTPSGKVALVPYGAQGEAYSGTPVDLISAFWDWYDALGQNYLDSDEAYTILQHALEIGTDPIEEAEQYIKDAYGNEIYSDYLRDYDTIFNTDRASDYI